METLEAELARARTIDIDAIADSIERFGFECTRCGACCTADGDDPHTATVFPDEARRLERSTGGEWRDVVRPIPYGLDADGTGETFEWALQTSSCGDCRFLESGGEEGEATCSVYGTRPSVCRTYPFSIAIDGTAQPMGSAVDRDGVVLAHECEGLGREIDRADAEALAAELKDRTVTELREMIATRDTYRSTDPDGADTVVYDSEGAKRPDGTPLERR